MFLDCCKESDGGGLGANPFFPLTIINLGGGGLGGGTFFGTVLLSVLPEDTLEELA